MGKVIYNRSFYCTQCGKEGIPIPRTSKRMKKVGHLKKLYCIYCQTETNHAECEEGTSYNKNTFLAEWQLNNFDETGNRKERACDILY